MSNKEIPASIWLPEKVKISRMFNHDCFSSTGGDLNKWKIQRAQHVVFVDVAAESVEQSKERYESRHSKSFSASFHQADLTRKDSHLIQKIVIRLQ
jgi:hypothetical protein